MIVGACPLRILEGALVALEPQHVVPAQGLTIWAALAVWPPMASMVARPPRSSNTSSSLGMISLDCASVASWSSTRRLARAQALTRATWAVQGFAFPARGGWHAPRR